MSESYSAMEAAQNGHSTYISMKPCKWGHQPPRKCRRDSGACVECYEMKRVGGSKELRFGTAIIPLISDTLRAVLAATGSGADMKAAERALASAAEALKSGQLNSAQVAAAIGCAPIQTDDGKLWALTSAGRSVGRAYVAGLLPGDAMNMGLVEPFGAP